MCGITAVITLDHIRQSVLNHRSRERLKSKLQKSLSNLHHRGPDSYGTWISDDNRVGKGMAFRTTFRAFWR